MARVLGLIAALLVLGLFPALSSAACSEIAATLAGPNCKKNGSWNFSCYAVSASNGNPEQTDIMRTGYQDGQPPDSATTSLLIRITCNLCTTLPAFTAAFGASETICKSGCLFKPGEDVQTDTVRTGSWLAQLKQGIYFPTGGKCPVGVPNDSPEAGRTLCGGSSCHDTAAGKYCAVDGNGVQVCVSDSTPPSGGCASSGDTTLCVGNPPPLPPNPPIADPASSAAGSDTYGHQSGNGAVTNTTVNNYNNTGSSPNNGAQAGDSGDAPGSNNPVPGGSHDPASSSSSGAPKGDGTRASGGQDCNSPPICEGSAATCMVAKQTWLLRCPPGGQAGDDSGSAGQDGNTDVPGLDGIGDTPGEGFMRSETVLDKLDQGGLGAGGGTCPKLVSLDLDQYGVHLDSDALPWCDILDAIRYMLLFLGAFVSLRILSSK